eukprot:TRINITY_DN997_c0_g1_i2.p1 TRINITY_DN997_c0_g1~~TRINITY_DN997_c0_g1_i2.p1  ORF type:complete len:248 (-),score=34.56 TRINITY_DN997_c0_g1_i2:34-777(-)
MGYWEPQTSSVDWCEPNYVWTHYVAEFWNTTSSLPIFFFGLYGMLKCMKSKAELRYLVSYGLLAVVGLGSVAFHGTLLWQGQMLDELPMVWASMAYLYTAINIRSTRNIPLAIGLTCFCIAFSLSYLFNPTLFFYFLTVYALAVASIVFFSARIILRSSSDQNEKNLVLGSILTYGFGFLFCWVPENLFCDRLQPFMLHAIFHLTSAFGSYLWLVFSYYERTIQLGQKPILKRNPILPFVLPVSKSN